MPEPLRKYLPGAPEFIPFSKELPKGSTSKRVKAAKEDKQAGSMASNEVADATERLMDVKVQ